jgi:hypothetical protein
MAEVLHDYGLVRSSEGTTYHVRVCGSEMDDSRWQGWLEFEPIEGGQTLRSPRETTQPNRTDTVYWAQGLTPVYLEGALERTRTGPVVRMANDPGVPAFDGPAPSSVTTAPAPASPSVLNPFSVYRKGEQLLRDQLAAMSSWHLVNIINAHRLSEIPAAELTELPKTQLIELIVASVRNSTDEPVRP